MRKLRWAGAKEAMQVLRHEDSVTLVRPAWYSTLLRGGDRPKPKKGHKIGVMIGCLASDVVVVISSRRDLERLKGTIEMALTAMDGQRMVDDA